MRARATRGMRVDDLEVQAPCFAISGESEAERAEAERRVRTQVAFYASTPSYRAFLDYHGYLDIAKRLSGSCETARSPRCRASFPMPSSRKSPSSGSRADLPRLLRERYAGGLLQCTRPLPSSRGGRFRRRLARVRAPLQGRGLKSADLRHEPGAS